MTDTRINYDTDLDRKPRCPLCTSDGAFDGRGGFTRRFKRLRANEPDSDVEQQWYVFGCGQCGNEFAVKEVETTEQA